MNFKINNLEFNIRNCTDSDYWFVYKITKNNMYEFFLNHGGRWDSKVFRNNFNKKIQKLLNTKQKE
jgi:hypothetical protein